MAGKGSRNRSANRAYWDAEYWQKDTIRHSPLCFCGNDKCECNPADDYEPRYTTNHAICHCKGNIRTMTIRDEQWYSCPRCGAFMRRPVANSTAHDNSGYVS